MVARGKDEPNCFSYVTFYLDYLGSACFFHVFKDRVVTKNPTRLLPEIPEGELTIQQLSNYTKNPLLVRVFHELNWAEDLGSGTRNILRYAPLYYPDYMLQSEKRNCPNHESSKCPIYETCLISN